MQFNNVLTIIYLIVLTFSVIIKVYLDVLNYNHRKKHLGKIPEDFKGMIDEKKLIQMDKYSNIKLFYSLIEYFFDKGLLLVILFLGLIPLYFQLITVKLTNIYLVGLIFFGGFYLIQLIFNIPFSLYFNFVIEKKFQFNKMTFKIWIIDFIKKLLLSIVLGTIIITALLFFIYMFKELWWLLIWGFFTLFSLFLQIIYPTVIAPMFNKFKPLENEDLKKRIEELLKSSGFKSSGVFEMDASKRSSHTNAYFTGIGKTKRIVLFDSLLKKHSVEEILAILAHEIGHFKYKHVLINLIGSLIISLAGLFLAYLLINNKLIYSAFGFGSNFDISNAKYVGLLLLSILAGPIGFFFSPVQAFISRKHEFQADEYSYKMIKNEKPLINALKKLSVDNLSNIYPHILYSSFYYSHPPILERINHLKKLKDS